MSSEVEPTFGHRHRRRGTDHRQSAAEHESHGAGRSDAVDRLAADRRPGGRRDRRLGRRRGRRAGAHGLVQERLRHLLPPVGADLRGRGAEIRDLVAGFDEPRRSHVLARFAEARQRLQESGMLDKLLARSEWNEDAVPRNRHGLFPSGDCLPVPGRGVLFDSSRSPGHCREYLVTSPAANCACPTKDNIEMVPLPVKVWTALGAV